MSLVRLPFAAAGVALLLAACGSDALPTPVPTSPPASTAVVPAATPGGSCTPAPAATGPASADNFKDTVCMLTLADGLSYGDLTLGTGATPKKGDNLSVQYTGWLSDGTVFDSSRQSGRTPFTFAIGTGAVIPGWDEGILTMHVGGKRRLVIPPTLAYGSQGQGPIPANATLTFDVELLAVK